MALNFHRAKLYVFIFITEGASYPEPDLYLNGNKIKVVRETKFLGVIFDQKLSFIPHLKSLKSRCMKALDIIKVVANQEWGADKSVLLNLYRSLIRSKLDYGCIVSSSGAAIGYWSVSNITCREFVH